MEMGRIGRLPKMTIYPNPTPPIQAAFTRQFLIMLAVVINGEASGYSLL